MSLERVQICKNKGDTAEVFEEKFLADNFDSLVAIEKMVGAVLALSSSCVVVGFVISFAVIFVSGDFSCVELKHEVPFEPAQIWSLNWTRNRLQKKNLKSGNSGQNGSFSSGSLFWSLFWAQFGFQFWFRFWLQFLVGQKIQKKPHQARRRFYKRWEIIFPDKHASKHFAGIQSGIRELHWLKPNKNLPKCILAVKAEKDFRIAF